MVQKTFLLLASIHLWCTCLLDPEAHPTVHNLSIMKILNWLLTVLFYFLFDFSMNEQLKLMESGTRWGRTDSVYLDSLRRTEDRKRVSNLNQIHTMAVERWFLLLMKQKYAGMCCHESMHFLSVKSQQAYIVHFNSLSTVSMMQMLLVIHVLAALVVTLYSQEVLKLQRFSHIPQNMLNLIQNYQLQQVHD